MSCGQSNLSLKEPSQLVDSAEHVRAAVKGGHQLGPRQAMCDLPVWSPTHVEGKWGGWAGVHSPSPRPHVRVCVRTHKFLGTNPHPLFLSDSPAHDHARKRGARGTNVSVAVRAGRGMHSWPPLAWALRRRTWDRRERAGKFFYIARCPLTIMQFGVVALR